MPESCRVFRKADGERIDLLAISPLVARDFAAADAGYRADVKALGQRPKMNKVWCRPVLWEGARDLMEGGKNSVWNDHHQSCARTSFSLGTWTQANVNTKSVILKFASFVEVREEHFFTGDSSAPRSMLIGGSS